MTRLGIRADARRSIVLSASTEMQDTLEHVLLVESAASALVDRALCGSRASD